MFINTKSNKLFPMRLLLCLNIIITSMVLIKLLIIHSSSSIKTKPKTELFIESGDEKLVTESQIIFGDNVLGYPINIVPNIFHYVLFDIDTIDFAHYISILSVLRNHKPEEIMFHCNCDKIVGKYWRNIINKANISGTKVTVKKVSKVQEIFGIPLSKKWINWHSSDITRLKVLMKYGGIYLDRDVYVVKSLNEFRKYEMSINWDEGQSIGNQVLIANKNARFLTLYLDTYRKYDPTKWYFNGGVLPTNAVLKSNPQLVHRVKIKFGVDGPVVCPRLFSENYQNWTQEYHTLHMYMRGNDMAHKECLRKSVDKAPLLTFDELNIKTLNVTFGQMARLVLYDTKDLIYH